MIVAISGCPRDNDISYTEKTVKSAIDAGAKCPIVVFDDLNWIGSAKACHELLKMCFDEYPNESVFLLEDDVISCRNALLAVEKVSFPHDCDMLSFFQCRKRYCDRAPKGIDFQTIDAIKMYRYEYAAILNGIHLQRAGVSFMFAQALHLSARLVEHIATSPWPSDSELKLTDKELEHMAPYSIRDKALGAYAAQVSPWIGQVAPNWFQHIGEMSAATALQFRSQRRTFDVVAGNWLGPDHDALTDDVSKIYHA